MKKLSIYLDSGHPHEIFEYTEHSNVEGFTTNPSLIRQAGVTDFRGFACKILESIRVKPVSFEVFADDLAGMYSQALEIASWGENVFVKIPVTNTQGQTTLPVIRELVSQGTKLNVTAVFTVKQVEDIFHALKGTAQSIISVFAGRIADTGRDPEVIMRQASLICSAAPQVKVLWASSREVFNYYQAKQCGCDIITLPPDLIKKLSLEQKDLEQFSLETVRLFRNDAVQSGLSL